MEIPNYIFKKYKLNIQMSPNLDGRGAFVQPVNTILISYGLTKEQFKITVAHELAHFFYQYELEHHNERITKRFESIDNSDLGGKISEMIAHIIGLYGAVIQQYTNKAMEILWKEA